MRVLPILLLIGLGGACTAHPHLRFDPERVDTDLRAEDDALHGRLVVVWRGLVERDGIAELRFQARLENHGDAPFPIAPAEFELLDSNATSLGFARLPDLPTAVESGRAVTLDLSFPVPSEWPENALDLQDLTLRVRLQGGRWDWTAPFEHDYRSADPSWG